MPGALSCCLQSVWRARHAWHAMPFATTIQRHSCKMRVFCRIDAELLWKVAPGISGTSPTLWRVPISGKPVPSVPLELLCPQALRTARGFAQHRCRRPDDCRYLQPSQFHQSQECTTHQLTQVRPPILLPCSSHAASPRQSQTTQVYEMTGPFGHASIIMWVMRGGQSSLT